MGSIIEKNQRSTISCYCTFKKVKITSEPKVGTESDIRDQRYRTEPDIGMKRAESDIISDNGIQILSFVRYPTFTCL